MLTYVLAIDPGLRATGYAYFCDGKLVRAGLKRSKLTERADAAASMGRELAVEFLKPIDALVVEVPQVYQPRLMKGDPNDLVSVALVAGCVLQLPARIPKAVSPHQWKGNTRKDICNARVMMSLNAVERDILIGADIPGHLVHNVLDAIGIGKWYIKHASRKERL